MVFDYFAFARAKKNQEALEKTNPQNPVLKDDDEKFLERVTTQDVPEAPLPPSVIKDDGTEQLAESKELKEAGEAAGSVALPATSEAEDANLTKAPASAASDPSPSKRTWGSYIPSVPSMPAVSGWRRKAEEKVPGANPESKSAEDAKDQIGGAQSATAADGGETEKAVDEKVDETVDEKVGEKTQDSAVAAYPPGVKVTENVKLDQEKKDADEKEVSVLLDRLNLSSINNRVFSFSKQSEKLYEDFTVVLKDMINGGPAAYEDMEKLLRDNDAHLREMFNNMPPFVQTLVKSLPAKLGTTLGPEIMAAASEKPGADMKARMQSASRPQSPAQTKKKQSVPSVKGLANEKGAIAGMLRSIVAFLKTRFPAFVTGTNVIMSLAVFILLFVFWYCHKRGRETRLLKEADAASAHEVSDVESGLDESQILTPDSTDAGTEKDVSGIGTPSVNSASVEAAQAILDQPAPAEVPLPEKAEEPELEGAKVKSP